MRFLDTVETIPEGIGFSAFGILHLVWLAICLIFTGVYAALYRKWGQERRSAWRKAMAVALVLNEAFKQVCLLIGGNWLPSYLPFHLCSINIFVIAWHAFKSGDLSGNFLYTVGIPGAAAALLFPSWASLPLGNFMHLHSFTVHILLLAYPVVLTVAGDIRPQLRKLGKCLLLLLLLAVVIYFINPLLDANFFFLAEADEGNPLTWFEQNWGNHLYGFPILLAAVVAIMHGPWLLAGKCRKKQNP